MDLSKDEKKYITRYIRLNQPCMLSDLTRELCYSHEGPRVNIHDMYRYLFWAVTREEIRLDPPIFDEAQLELFKGYTIHDLLLKHIDSRIFIPNYISKVWQNWCIKRINNE